MDQPYDPQMVAKYEKLDRDCLAIQDRLSRADNGRGRLITYDYDYDEIEELMFNTFPDPDDLRNYYEWGLDRFKSTQEDYMDIPANPVTDYYAAVATTDLRDEQALNRLIAVFDGAPYPYIGIGTHKGHRYRLKPMTQLLEPDEDAIWWKDPVEFAPAALVGIEIKGPEGAKFSDPGAQSDFRRNKRRFLQFNTDESYFSSASEESVTVSADSNFGFAFLPLGQVYCIPESDFQSEIAKTPPTEKCDMMWRNSHFILGVTTVSATGGYGRAGEVWLLQAFVSEDEIDNTEMRIDEEEDWWGYLEGDDCTFQRAGIKIADSFEQLQDDYRWVVEKHFESKYDVTQALIFQDDRKGAIIVRQEAHRWRNAGEVRENSSDK